MKPRNADNFLFRASSMGAIMTGVKKKWDVDHSITCQRKLVELYREKCWGRKAEIGNKYTEKGLKVEEDSLTLYSAVKKHFFVKNDIRLTNEFFTGECDTYIGESIEKAESIFDIKSVWNWSTLPSIIDAEPDDAYFYQGQVYMHLTGAKEHTIVYCLVNTPANLIEREIKNLVYEGFEIGEPAFVEKAQDIEINSIVDVELFKKHFPNYQFYNKVWEFDIAPKERVFEINFKRDEQVIDAMIERVKDCRNWLNNNFFNI